MRKRFIAGAKCPQCEQQDKIFVYKKDGEDVAECNACGYISVRPKEVEPLPESEQPVDGIVKIIK
ncbi:MAG: YheV family putative metal-binding protein [Ketobacter sp.]|nr:MAG: YheV family putative metal-binding protein [Ketobacter sp.]